MTEADAAVRSASQELIEELMGTIVALDSVLRTLMDLPADALPGGMRVEAVRDLLTASACHEVEAAGADACRAATALIGTVLDRIEDDVRALSGLAAARGLPPC